jgi:hypothetical protein
MPWLRNLANSAPHAYTSQHHTYGAYRRQAEFTTCTTMHARIHIQDLHPGIRTIFRNFQYVVRPHHMYNTLCPHCVHTHTRYMHAQDTCAFTNTYTHIHKYTYTNTYATGMRHAQTQNSRNSHYARTRTLHTCAHTCKKLITPLCTQAFAVYCFRAHVCLNLPYLILRSVSLLYIHILRNHLHTYILRNHLQAHAHRYKTSVTKVRANKKRSISL